MSSVALRPHRHDRAPRGRRGPRHRRSRPRRARASSQPSSGRCDQPSSAGVERPGRARRGCVDQTDAARRGRPGRRARASRCPRRTARGSRAPSGPRSRTACDPRREPGGVRAHAIDELARFLGAVVMPVELDQNGDGEREHGADHHRDLARERAAQAARFEPGDEARLVGERHSGHRLPLSAQTAVSSATCSREIRPRCGASPGRLGSPGARPGPRRPARPRPALGRHVHRRQGGARAVRPHGARPAAVRLGRGRAVRPARRPAGSSTSGRCEGSLGALALLGFVGDDAQPGAVPRRARPLDVGARRAALRRDADRRAVRSRSPAARSAPRAKRALGVVLAFAGVAYLLLGRGLTFDPRWLVGDLLIFLAVIAWAVYTTRGKRADRAHGAAAR